MSNRVIHCPSCGGPTEVRSRSIQVVVCSFCSQSITLTPDGVEANGKSAALTDMFTELSNGAAGKLGSRGFQVVGRVRYAWSAGYWDEWSLAFDDGTSGWLHEDEGEVTLLQEVALQAPVNLRGARVGTKIRVNGTEVYVTEMRTAHVHGGEGQLSRGMIAGQEMFYLDGKAGGRAWMLEEVDGHTELFVGEAIADDALEVYGA